MTVDETTSRLTGATTGSNNRRRSIAGRLLLRGGALWLVLALAGGATLLPQQALSARLITTTSGWTFSIFRWELGALRDKLEAAVAQPGGRVDEAEGTRRVRAYLATAAEIADKERAIERILSETGGASTPETAALQTTIEQQRARQSADRPAVEQIIERQVSAELARQGLTLGPKTFPPVQFVFTEPPKKLIVSPRDRIATVYYRMLDATFSTADAETAETTIRDELGLSGYVTRIGGLGAYPSMVIERADVPWILSTVAHEWVHNYLTLFPLGLRYNVNPQLTTMNETVAEIVGNEIGAAVVARLYPELAPPPPGSSSASTARYLLPSGTPTPFDFRAEMRTTRLKVDELLAAGRIEEAERYMEERRQLFVAQGYPIRKLNQAYFAFHGSYGTSAASTDPIGPKLFALRDRSSDVRSFLRTVRGITAPEQLDALLNSAP